MRTKDFIFILIVIAVFLPFIISDAFYDWYLSFNAEHGMAMSFLKFGILATMGELLGLRISRGVYYFEGFGVLPRAIVWGILGMGINMAFIVFSTGVPAFAEYLGVKNTEDILSGALSWQKVALAFSISVVLNSIFAPVFMTLHKITDTHIMNNGGTLSGLFTPIKMGEIMQNLNWKVQWGFVFKKTIPLFWFPAHTITFLLPGEMRVLFAALLGVLLGVILSIAARKK